ncbi:MAG: hypothetical protein M3268_02395 [Acidobacteriota bacterium]|nr:hypothetical protein [Acidobacteriota bacterium]
MFKRANVRRVVERWRDEGLTLLAPVEEREVIERLSGAGRLISRDVVELYCTTGGMTGDGMSPALLNLWPLYRVVSESARHGGPILLFADFLIDSHFYGLRYENEYESSVHVEYFDGELHPKVAGSLDEFFYLYLNDPGKIGLITD